MEIKVGQFVVVPGYTQFSASLVRIDALTPKLIKTKRSWGEGFNHTDRESVMAVFDTQDEAERLINGVGGVRGEYDRRVRAAADAARKGIAALVQRARDSGSDRNGENARSAVEGEASQSGGEAASPDPSSLPAQTLLEDEG